MHQRPHYRALLLLILMLLPMIACSSLLGGQEEEQEVPVAAEPTSTSAAQQDSESETSSQDADGVPDQDAEQQESGAEANAGSDAASGAERTSIQPNLPFNNDALPFHSYQIRMQFSALSADQTSSVEMNIARDVTNQAASYQMSVTGVPEMVEQGADSIAIVAVGDAVYMPADDDCMVMPSGMGNPVEQIWTRNSFLLMDDSMQVQFVGDQNLNGLPVQEYRLTDINAADMLNASGTLYTYKLPDGQDVVLKAEMAGTSAKNPLTQADEESTITYTFELFAVDEAVSINVPEECQNPAENPLPDSPAEPVLVVPAQGQPSAGYPVYPGSGFVGGYAGAENYIIPQTAVDTAQIAPKDFYVQEFGSQGYALAQELAAGPSISLTFQKEGSGTLQVMLVGENGDINVTIIGLPDTP